jgi:hypothetical protein
MSTIFVDNDKSTTFISEEKSTGMYFLLNYRLIKNSSCKDRHHRHRTQNCIVLKATVDVNISYY